MKVFNVRLPGALSNLIYWVASVPVAGGFEGWSYGFFQPKSFCYSITNTHRSWEEPSHLKPAGTSPWSHLTHEADPPQAPCSVSQQALDSFVLLVNPHGNTRGKYCFEVTWKLDVHVQYWGHKLLRADKKAAGAQHRISTQRCLRRGCTVIFSTNISFPCVSTTQQWPHSCNTAVMSITLAPITCEAMLPCSPCCCCCA